jgi:hypothetical protein
MSNINDIQTGLRVASQIPLNPKQEAISEMNLKNLGVNNNLAFTYPLGMVVLCIKEETRWIWRPALQGEIGLLDTNFIYPVGLVVNGIDYGNKAYNFFQIKEYVDYQTLINSLDLQVLWKMGDYHETRNSNQLPRLVTNNIYTRNGFVGYNDPIVSNGILEHPSVLFDLDAGPTPMPCRLLEVDIQNLIVDIKNFDKISAFNPKLHLARYTHTKSKGISNLYPEVHHNTHWRKGSFKISKKDTLVRPHTIPLHKGYQIIDFGQEHYFKTDHEYSSTGNVETPSFLYARNLLRRTSQSRDYKGVLENRAFLYFELHVSIEINGKKLISKALTRFKMQLEMSSCEVGEEKLRTKIIKRANIKFRHV